MIPLNRIAAGILFTLSSVFLSASPSQASFADLFFGDSPSDLIDKATAAIDSLAEKHIEELLTGLEKWSDETIRQGSNEGKLLLVQAGNEARMTINVIRQQFGAEMTKQVKSASAELRPLLIELEKWRQSTERLKTFAIEMEDTIAMDLERLPFGKEYFGIRRVVGAVIVPEPSPSHTIRVIGANLGTVLDGREVKVTASLDGVDLGAPRLSPPHEVSFDIPDTMLRAKFARTAIVTVPMKFKLTKSESGIFGKETSIEQEVPLILLPALVGKLRYQTTRPQYRWVSDQPVEQSQVIMKDAPFILHVSRPIGGSQPVEGSQRFTGEVDAICLPVYRPGRRFPNGKEIRDTDTLMTKGWVWHRWIGKDPKDWDEANRDLRNALGIKVSFHKMNRCPKDKHCFLTPGEMRKFSAPITIAVEDCRAMSKDDAGNMNADRSQLTVNIRGTATSESRWVVTAAAEVYREVDPVEDPYQEIDLFAGEAVRVEVKDFVDTLTEVVFIPTNGYEKFGTLGKDIEKGPKVVDGGGEVGTKLKRVRYLYDYDTTLWR